MLGFWAVAMRLVFCASSGDKDNPRTAPMAARARVIFPIRFVMSVIAFCKAQFDSRNSIPTSKLNSKKQTRKNAAWRDKNYPGACCSHLLFCLSELDHFTE